LLALLLAVGSCPKQASEQGDAATAQASGTAGAETQAQQSVVYTCPMHPQVQQAQPGKCPICGMDLVKKE
jgi:rubrerythrin